MVFVEADFLPDFCAPPFPDFLPADLLPLLVSTVVPFHCVWFTELLASGVTSSFVMPAMPCTVITSRAAVPAVLDELGGTTLAEPLATPQPRAPVLTPVRQAQAPYWDLPE